MPNKLIDTPDPFDTETWSNGEPVVEPSLERNGSASEYGLIEDSPRPPENMGTRIHIKDLLGFVPEEDENSVIGNRYLCRGGSCVIVAQTSAGKSSLGMQMAIMFAIGVDFYTLKPCRPLKSLIVQAENDLGDTAEMFRGVLMGMNLISTDNEDGNNALVAQLQKNLIIVRDQTHIGVNFPAYAEKLVAEHKPDLFWVDPLLSFFGDDINDQKSMSEFLRAKLNPISERTGIIWMMLHHTGKPGKDAAKTQKGWSARDFSYMGIGSSELSNWARAIICLTASGEDEFRMIFAKRGWRAGILDDSNQPCSELHLAYSTDHICWRRIPKPKDDDAMQEPLTIFARSIIEPMRATAIVKLASERLKRGVRTCWKMWDNGEGILGRCFMSDGGDKRPDAGEFDRLASALARLNEAERQLSNRSLPPSQKPISPGKSRREIEPSGEPMPATPAPVRRDDPNEPNG